MKRNSFTLISLLVLMPLLTVVFITGCGIETEQECYKRNIAGRTTNVDITWSNPLPLGEIWGITSARLYSRLTPLSGEIVFNADGSYVIQATSSNIIGTNPPSLTLPSGGFDAFKLGGDGGVVEATFHLEERGTYEIFDANENSWNTIYIKFFPERVDARLEDGAYFRYYYPSGRKVYLNVEAMNEWLNDGGAYGRTMMSDVVFYDGTNKRYSGEEIDLSFSPLGEELQMDCPYTFFNRW